MKKTIFFVLAIGALISVVGAGCGKTATNTNTNSATGIINGSANTAIKNTNSAIANANSSVATNTNTSKTNTNASVNANSAVNTNASSMKTYTNTANGFSFQYPGSWTYAEKSEKLETADNKTCNSVTFKNGTNELNVFYRKTSDAKSTTACRSGTGAGDFVKATGAVKFGSTTLEKQNLTLEDKVSSVFYNAKGKTGEIVEGALGFQLYFDDMTTDTADLSSAEIAAAESIIASYSKK